MTTAEGANRSHRAPADKAAPERSAPRREDPRLTPRFPHYRWPAPRPFTADEKANTTILLASLTSKHDPLVRAVFERGGYRCVTVPAPGLSAFRLGKEHCNNGLCNPVYFTAGALLEAIREIEGSGVPRSVIGDRYLYFTAGGCGPCRFGMYAAQYAQALEQAGYERVRVVTFQQTRVVRDGADAPGFAFSVDFGLGIVNALNLGDMLYQIAYKIRPYELRPGETDRVVAECLSQIAEFLRSRTRFDLSDHVPTWARAPLARRPALYAILRRLDQFRAHFYGDEFVALLADCARRLGEIEVDWLRVKPVVKIVGEFYSHLSEGDANYSMFAFLEREGAEVAVTPLVDLVFHLLYQPRLSARRRLHLRRLCRATPPWDVRARLAERLALCKTSVPLTLAERLYLHQYRRVARALGGLVHDPAPPGELARLAGPYYDPQARGGEMHLEVAESIYFTRHRLAHMVLSLKPFGCMPSIQSDGVMATVAERFDGMLFHSVETSGDGEINAYSRVQMALGEARRAARAELDEALTSAGRSLDEIREYVAEHPEMRRALYRFPRGAGTAGTAASFARHVADRMHRARGAAPLSFLGRRHAR